MSELSCTKIYLNGEVLEGFLCISAPSDRSSELTIEILYPCPVPKPSIRVTVLDPDYNPLSNFAIKFGNDTGFEFEAFVTNIDPVYHYESRWYMRFWQRAMDRFGKAFVPTTELKSHLVTLEISGPVVDKKYA